jgi:hypothetical protein
MWNVVRDNSIVKEAFGTFRVCLVIAKNVGSYFSRLKNEKIKAIPVELIGE